MARTLALVLVGVDKFSKTLQSAGKNLDGFRTKLEKFEGPATAAGIAAGAAFAGAMGEALNRSAGKGLLTAQLGLTAKEADRIGKVAGDLFANNFGGSMEEVNGAVKSVIQNMDGMRTASAKTLQDTTARALTLSGVMGEDVAKVTSSVSTLMRTGLAKSSKEAFDVLLRGAQLGADKQQDLLDTMTEYPTLFRNMGLSGSTAMGLIVQGLQAGARNSDIVADAIKEFSIRAVDGSKLTSQGFQMIGLDAGKMASAIGKGGSSANKALDLTLTKLRGIEDPVKRSQAAVALFGTQAEDLGQALFALDPSSAAKKLDGFKGSVDAATKATGETAAARFETFKRSVMNNLVSAADTVISKFNALSPETQGLITKVATAAAVIAPFGLVLLKVTQGALALGSGVIKAGTGVLQFTSGVLKGSAALGENASMAAKAGAGIRSFGSFMVQGAVSTGKMFASVGAMTLEGIKYTATMVGGAAKTALFTAAQIASNVASKALAIGIRLVNAAMRANPIGIVITLITALVGIIVLAYNKNETFRKIVQAVWKGIQTAISYAWNNIIKPVFTALFNFIVNVLGPKIMWFHNNVVSPIFKKVGQVISFTWNNVIKPVFSFLAKFITQDIPNAFKSGVAAVGRFWDKLKEIARKPVAFVVNTIYNNGIRRVWNWVAEKVSLPLLPEIQGFATGGPIKQGSTSKADDVVIRASRGEYMVNAAATRKNLGLIDYVNREGKNKSLAKNLGLAGDPGGMGLPGFQEGGIIGWVKSFGQKAKDWFLNGLMSAARKVLDPIVGLARRAIGGTPFGGMIAGAVENLAGGLLNRFKPLESEMGGPGRKAVNKAKTAVGTPYSWGGGGPYGPSYGIQQGANIRGFDCSSLMQYGWYGAVGRVMPRTTYTQRPWLTPVSQPREGDLGQPHPGHTYMYAGKGQVVEAPYTGASVRVRSVGPTSFWGRPPASFMRMDSGGVLSPGLNAVYNGTGGPEPLIRPDAVQPIQIGELHVHVEYGLDEVSQGRKILRALEAAVGRDGKTRFRRLSQ